MRWTIAVIALLGLGAQQDAPPQIHKQGKMEFPNACTVDLDEGKTDFGNTLFLDGEYELPIPADRSFKGSDFWFEAGKRRFFRPEHGALFSKNAFSAASYADCALATYSKGAIRIDKLPIDSQICVRTSEGRYASIQIKGYESSSTRISFTYIVWEKQNPSAAAKPHH